MVNPGGRHRNNSATTHPKWNLGAGNPVHQFKFKHQNRSSSRYRYSRKQQSTSRTGKQQRSRLNCGTGKSRLPSNRSSKMTSPEASRSRDATARRRCRSRSWSSGCPPRRLRPIAGDEVVVVGLVAAPSRAAATALLGFPAQWNICSARHAIMARGYRAYSR